MDPQAKLVDFMKFDSVLSREQNIDMGRPSTLGDFDAIAIENGVKLV